MVDIFNTIAEWIWAAIAAASGWTPDPDLKSKLEFGAAAFGVGSGFYGLYWFFVLGPRERVRLEREGGAARAREQERDEKINELHAIVHKMAAHIAATQAANAPEPVSQQQIVAATEGIEAAATDLASRDDDRSKAALAALQRGEIGPAKRLYGEILELKGHAGAELNKEAADAARAIGAFTRLSNVSEAAGLYGRAAMLDPEDFPTWIHYGDLSIDAGQTADAIAAFQQALKVAANAQDDRSRSVAYDRVGDVQVAQGNLSDALTSYQSSLDIAARLSKSDPGNAGWQRDLSVSYNRVGDIEADIGNISAAIERYEASLAIINALAARWPDHPQFRSDVAFTRQRLAGARAKQ